MALRKVVDKLRTPVQELDRREIAQFCEQLGVTMIEDLSPRRPARVAGEVRSVRIVPRAGAPAVEATVTDGRASLTAIFLGRRKIAGISPGRRVVLEGVPAAIDARLVVYNPRYQLLA